MRVLAVHHAWPPESQGGSEIAMAALVRALSARGHDVAVLCPGWDPARPANDLAESTLSGARVWSLNRPPAGFESYRDPAATAAVARVLDDFRPELVHVGHLGRLPAGLVFEARRRGAAVVITLHDFWPVCALGQLLDRALEVCPGPTPRRCLGCVGDQALVASATSSAFTGMARVATPQRAAPPVVATLSARAAPAAARGARLLARATGLGSARVAERLETMREVLRAADILLAPSEFLARRMAGLGVRNVRVTPNGHEPLAVVHRTTDAYGRVRFGFVGAAVPSKGVHVLAEAYRLLAEPRAALRIHGPFVPYHGEAGYEARVRAVLGPFADDALRGPFPHARLADVLAGLDVLVVPSLWEENAPLVVQEALQARLPLLVSGHGALANTVRDGVDGLRFRPGDATDLARVMRRLLDEPDLLTRLGRHPPEVLTIDEHVRQVEDTYEEAVRCARARAGPVGVVVLDCGRPQDAERAARSALDPTLSPRVVVVENGPGDAPVLPEGVELIRLPRNVGYAGGMNAGLRWLRAAGCDRLLLLNNDAVLEPGCLRRLAEALEDDSVAAVGPTVLRFTADRVESQGSRLRPWGRHRLAGSGHAARAREGRISVDSLSGAVWMLRSSALDRVGWLDDDYFFGFEDADWCLRARAAGLRVEVVLGARARHAGGRTLGSESPSRLYYAARNHLRVVERRFPRGRAVTWARRAIVVALNLAHAVRQGAVPRGAGAYAVLHGAADFLRGRAGPEGGRP